MVLYYLLRHRKALKVHMYSRHHQTTLRSLTTQILSAFAQLLYFSIGYLSHKKIFLFTYSLFAYLTQKSDILPTRSLWTEGASNYM